MVSIHVSTRGTTSMFSLLSVVFGVSIHVPTRGTTEYVKTLVAGVEFQSTFPRGERPKHLSGIDYVRCFNPRSHEGNDQQLLTVRDILFIVSIHVPTRGTTGLSDPHL